VTQAKLRGMAQERIEDAKILIDGGRWWFGYYVSGYAVECALKACVLAQMVGTGWVFLEDEKKLRECRTHDFMRLISIAGMHDPLNARLKRKRGGRRRLCRKLEYREGMDSRKSL
jgi:hypothetical protein